MAGDANATTGIQELGTEVLSTKSGISGGLASPLRGFRFTANFEGLGTTSFKEIQGGWGVTVNESTYREGAFGYLTQRKVPGLVEYSDFSLKKGMYSSPLLYNWFNDYLEGSNFMPVNGTIILFDNAGKATTSWTIINAWPKGYESDGLDATNSDIIYETITIAHEGIKRDTSVATA